MSCRRCSAAPIRSSARLTAKAFPKTPATGDWNFRSALLIRSNTVMRSFSAAVLAMALAGCSRPQPTFDSINADSLLGEIRILSSDAFEGRKPGTAGEEKTIAYLQQQFQQIGLK